MAESKGDKPEKGPIWSAVIAAIKADGRPLLQIAKKAGIEPGMFYRLASGERGCTMATLDKIAPVLGLRIEVDRPATVETVSQVEDRMFEKFESMIEDRFFELERRLSKDSAARQNSLTTPEQAHLDADRKARSTIEKSGILGELRGSRRRYSKADKDAVLQMLQAGHRHVEIEEATGVPMGNIGRWAVSWKRGGKLEE